MHEWPTLPKQLSSSLANRTAAAAVVGNGKMVYIMRIENFLNEFLQSQERVVIEEKSLRKEEKSTFKSKRKRDQKSFLILLTKILQTY